MRMEYKLLLQAFLFGLFVFLIGWPILYMVVRFIRRESDNFVPGASELKDMVEAVEDVIGVNTKEVLDEKEEIKKESEEVTKKTAIQKKEEKKSLPEDDQPPVETSPPETTEEKENPPEEDQPLAEKEEEKLKEGIRTTRDKALEDLMSSGVKVIDEIIEEDSDE